MVRDSRGYRFGLGAALAALIVVCVGLGLYIGALSSTQNGDGANQRYQAELGVEALSNNAALPQISRGENYNPPCRQGEENRNSDLCAQWKAADAANQSAIWTRTSALVAIAAAVIAGLTLFAAAAAAWFARQAARHTESGARAGQAAVDETRRIGEAQVRAYLSIANVFMGLHNGKVPVITLRVNNAGQSPALDFSAKIILYWMDLKKGNLDRQIVGGSGPLLATIPARAENHGLLYDMKGEFLPSELEQLDSGEMVLFLCANVWLKWRDVFGVEAKLFGSYVGAFPLLEHEEVWRLGSGNEALTTVQAEKTSRERRKQEEDHSPRPDEGEAAD